MASSTKEYTKLLMNLQCSPWSTCMGSKLIVTIWNAGFNPSKRHIWCSTLSAVDEHWSYFVSLAFHWKRAHAWDEISAFRSFVRVFFGFRKEHGSKWVTQWPSLRVTLFVFGHFLEVGSIPSMSTITAFQSPKKNTTKRVFFYFQFGNIFSQLDHHTTNLLVFFSFFFLLTWDLQNHLGPIQTTNRCEGAATSLPMGHDLATGPRVQTHKRQRSPEMIKFFGWIISK